MKRKTIAFWVSSIFFFILLGLHSPFLTSRFWQNLGGLDFVQALTWPASELPPYEITRGEARLRRAAAYYPDNDRAWRQLGFILLAQGREDETIAAWQRAKGLAQELVAWGKVLFIAGQNQKALSWYHRALEVAPALGRPWYHIGLVYEQQGQWPAAADAFRRAQQGGDTQEISSSLDFHLGRFLHLGLSPPDLPAAQALYEQALGSNRFAEEWERIDTHFHYGDILRRQGQFEEARQEFLYVVDQEPDHYRGNVWLGELTWQLYNDVAGAEQFLNRAIASNPDLIWGYKRLANIYLEAGQLAKASETYRRVLEIDPNDQVALQFFAQ